MNKAQAINSQKRENFRIKKKKLVDSVKSRLHYTSLRHYCSFFFSIHQLKTLSYQLKHKVLEVISQSFLRGILSTIPFLIHNKLTQICVKVKKKNFFKNQPMQNNF